MPQTPKTMTINDTTKNQGTLFGVVRNVQHANMQPYLVTLSMDPF